MTEIGVLVEQNLIGESYLKNLRSACARKGIRIVAEAAIAQTAQDINDAVRTLHDAKAEAIVHSASASESSSSTPRSRRSTGIRRGSPRTAFQNAWVNPIMWNAFMGWTGVDQYDEGNPIGQDFLDRYAKRYDGSRPEYCVPVVNRDVAATLVRAFADAHPLSPRGVKEALERVKMMPAASGAPGTRVSFGKWTRRAWMGAGYLVARTPRRRRHQLALGGSVRRGADHDHATESHQPTRIQTARHRPTRPRRAPAGWGRVSPSSHGSASSGCSSPSRGRTSTRAWPTPTSRGGPGRLSSCRDSITGRSSRRSAP